MKVEEYDVAKQLPLYSLVAVAGTAAAGIAVAVAAANAATAVVYQQLLSALHPLSLAVVFAVYACSALAQLPQCHSRHGMQCIEQSKSLGTPQC